MTQKQTEAYLKAVELAEAGQYQPALRQIQEYLKTHPDDGEALNDAGTILFCMHRGKEAIEYFLRARTLTDGDIQSQVLHNLCEAYLAERQPEKTVGLLKDMETRQILNVDTINRIANAFVEKSACGPAIEMLLYSLRLAPNQEILYPMLQILRSRRIKLALFSDREEKCLELKRFLEDRFVVKSFPGADFGSEASTTQSVCDVSVYVGADCFAKSAGFAGSGRAIVFLEYEDLSNPEIEQIPWERVHTLVVPDSQVRELWKERLETVPASLQILTLPPCVEVESVGFIERKKGKRIAAFGPWNACQNPMFLLQCMQKLHYLDPDFRLYMIGNFQDASIRNYTESMIDAMELENAVFLDDMPKNLGRWLRDKHYIVSTAVDGRAMKGVWTGMAAGLRPVVHRFPGVSDFLDPDYQFVLAEDFCRQILEGEYHPCQYRQTVAERYSTMEVYPQLLRVFSEIEHGLLRPSETVSPERPAAVIPTAEGQTAGSILRPESVSIPSNSPSPMQNPPPSPERVPALSDSESIEGLAEKALQAARRLSELSREHENPSPKTGGPSEGGLPAVPFLEPAR